MDPSTAPKPKVLIIGSGLGGMALAQSLRKQGVPFQLFERDEEPHARFQGWAISLHWMLDNLKASTPDDMPPIETVSNTYSIGKQSEGAFWDALTGKEVFHLKAGDGLNLLRADRTKLRDWLAMHLDIKWGKRFVRYEEREGGVTAYFEDGTSYEGDVLVGADGSRSRVRANLFHDNPLKLRDLPLALVGGVTTLTKEQYEQQFKLGTSFYLVLAEDKRIFVGLKNVADDKATAEYYWMHSWHIPMEDVEAHWTKQASKQEMHDYALKSVTEFQPSLTEIVRLTPVDGMMQPPIAMHDLLPIEPPLGRVTLLGDAAHPMTPFRGEGGNHALQDGLNLARAISEAKGSDVPSMLKAYEKEMIPRASEAVTNSRKAAEDRDALGSRIRAGWVGCRKQGGKSVESQA